MTPRRLFLDTVFVQALFNRADQYHSRAMRWLPHLQTAGEIWITEAVLVEVANALSAINRPAAVEFAEEAYRTAHMHVISVDRGLLQRALRLYRERPDKQWGLTDCISFVVMAEQSLTDALTADHHFAQAGFVPLLLRDPDDQP